MDVELIKAIGPLMGGAAGIIAVLVSVLLSLHEPGALKRISKYAQIVKDLNGVKGQEHNMKQVSDIMKVEVDRYAYRTTKRMMGILNPFYILDSLVFTFLFGALSYLMGYLALVHLVWFAGPVALVFAGIGVVFLWWYLPRNPYRYLEILDDTDEMMKRGVESSLTLHVAMEVKSRISKIKGTLEARQS